MDAPRELVTDSDEGYDRSRTPQPRSRGKEQCPHLLEGGGLSLRRSLGPRLQLLAQRRQLLRLRHHRGLFLINHLERGEKRSG